MGSPFGTAAKSVFSSQKTVPLLPVILINRTNTFVKSSHKGILRLKITAKNTYKVGIMSMQAPTGLLIGSSDGEVRRSGSLQGVGFAYPSWPTLLHQVTATLLLTLYPATS